MAARNNGIKKHDYLRIFGEPLMVIGHAASFVVDTPATMVAKVVGAVMMTVWVGFEVKEFVDKRRRTANRRVCSAA